MSRVPLTTGGGLFELRFTCEGTARRVTRYIARRLAHATGTTLRIAAPGITDIGLGGAA
ncbi:MAG: hypothetical protein J2P32_01775 [Actinobacteria bacterium]|nr:hypothetical protein [Actinomycetota bacterium]